MSRRACQLQVLPRTKMLVIVDCNPIWFTTVPFPSPIHRVLPLLPTLTLKPPGLAYLQLLISGKRRILILPTACISTTRRSAAAVAILLVTTVKWAWREWTSILPAPLRIIFIDRMMRSESYLQAITRGRITTWREWRTIESTRSMESLAGTAPG